MYQNAELGPVLQCEGIVALNLSFSQRIHSHCRTASNSARWYNMLNQMTRMLYQSSELGPAV